MTERASNRSRVALTGANSAVGRAIVRAVGSAVDGPELVAVVRSERAAGEVPEIAAGRGRVAIAAYSDGDALAAAFAGCSAVVHLPGVLVERRGSTYEDANVETTRAALAAARRAGVGRFVLVSAHGADARSANRYLRTKGAAEELVRESGLRSVILRAPLLVGPGTQEARVLAGAVARGSAWLVGGGSALEQPLDVDDLARAALAAASAPGAAEGRVLAPGGPEQLTARALFERAAKVAGRAIRLRSLPAAPLRLALALRTRLAGPGPSPDFLDVLLAGTRGDPEVLRALGVEPTPLDATIRRGLDDPEGTK